MNIENLRALAEDFVELRARIRGLDMITQEMYDALTALPDMARYRSTEELIPLANLVETLQRHAEMQKAILSRHWNDLTDVNVRLSQAGLALRQEILSPQQGETCHER